MFVCLLIFVATGLVYVTALGVLHR